MAIWGCLPPTALASHPHSVPAREAVSHEPPLLAAQGWASGPQDKQERAEGTDG